MWNNVADANRHQKPFNILLYDPIQGIAPNKPVNFNLSSHLESATKIYSKAVLSILKDKSHAFLLSGTLSLPWTIEIFNLLSASVTTLFPDSKEFIQCFCNGFYLKSVFEVNKVSNTKELQTIMH